jgi:hypothetical protein
MKNSYVRIALVLLIFNSISAMFGGLGLISDPTGTQMQMPIEWLDSTPFINYLIPGIILFTVNGLFNFASALFVIYRKKYFQYLIFASGAMLTGWLTVQIIIIKMFYPPLHIPYYTAGILLMIFGILIHRQIKTEGKV